MSLRIAIGYVRVSTKDQADTGHSLPEQERRIREYAARHGFSLRRVIVARESAKRTGRKSFDALLSEFKGRSAAQAIICEEPDRSTRNPHDQLALEDLRAAGVEIHFSRSGLVIGRDTDPGIIMGWRQQVVMAQYTVEKLSQEIRKGQQGALRENRWPHKAPPGLVRINAAGEHARFGPHPVNGPALRTLAERVIAGDTIAGLVPEAARLGLRTSRGRPLSAWELGAALRHPVTGGFCPRGGWRQKRHGGETSGPLLLEVATNVEPAIPRERWLALQRALDARSFGRGRRRQDRDYLFAGILRVAGCGHAMVADFQRGRHGRGAYTYYRGGVRGCPTCTGPRVREDRIAAQVEARLERLTFPPEIVSAVGAHLRREAEAATPAREAKEKRLVAEDALLAARLRRLTLALADGALAPDEHGSVAGELRRRREEVAAELASTRAEESQAVDRAVRLMEVARSASAAWRGYDASERRELIGILFEAPLRLRAGVLEASFVARFQPLAAAAAGSSLTPAKSLNRKGLAVAGAPAAESGHPTPKHARKSSGVSKMQPEASAHPSWRRVRGVHPTLVPWLEAGRALMGAA